MKRFILPLLIALTVAVGCGRDLEPLAGYFPVALAQGSSVAWLAVSRFDEKADQQYRLELYGIAPSGGTSRLFSIPLGNTLAGGTTGEPPMFAAAVTEEAPGRPTIAALGYYTQIGFAMSTYDSAGRTGFAEVGGFDHEVAWPWVPELTLRAAGGEDWWLWSPAAGQGGGFPLVRWSGGHAKLVSGSTVWLACPDAERPCLIARWFDDLLAVHRLGKDGRYGDPVTLVAAPPWTGESRNGYWRGPRWRVCVHGGRPWLLGGTKAIALPFSTATPAPVKLGNDVAALLSEPGGQLVCADGRGDADDLWISTEGAVFLVRPFEGKVKKTGLSVGGAGDGGWWNMRQLRALPAGDGGWLVAASVPARSHPIDCPPMADCMAGPLYSHDLKLWRLSPAGAVVWVRTLAAPY